MPGVCSELCVSFLSSRVPQPQEEGYLSFWGEKAEAQEKGVVAPGPQLVSGGARTPAESTTLPPPASEAHLAAPGSVGQVPAGRAPHKHSPRGQDLKQLPVLKPSVDVLIVLCGLTFGELSVS